MFIKWHDMGHKASGRKKIFQTKIGKLGLPAGMEMAWQEPGKAQMEKVKVI